MSRFEDALARALNDLLDPAPAAPAPVSAVDLLGGCEVFVELPPPPRPTRDLTWAVAPSAPEPAAAPTGRWTPGQRRALRRLVALGARLAPDPEPEAVRAAFRRLAHALHPDTGGATADPVALADLLDAWAHLRPGPLGRADDGLFHPLFG